VALVTTTFLNSTGKFHLHVESKFSTINAPWGTCKCQALSLSFFFFLVLSGGQTENVKLVQWQKFV